MSSNNREFREAPLSGELGSGRINEAKFSLGACFLAEAEKRKDVSCERDMVTGFC